MTVDVGSAFQAPDFGTVVERKRLLKRFVDDRPRVAVLVAPGGYGKSVLAAQIVGVGEFEACVWIDLAGALAEEGQLVKLVAQRLSPHEAHGILPVSESEPYPVAKIEQCLQPLYKRRVCLVLDNLSVLRDASGLECILSTLSRCTSPASRLVATAREATVQVQASQIPLTLEVEALTLDNNEAHEIADQIAGEELANDEVNGLWTVCGGQAALFSVLLRHRHMSGLAFGPETKAGSDIRSYLLHLADSQLKGPELEVLYVASILGNALGADVLRVAGRETEWAKLQRIAEDVPLICLSRSATGRRCIVHDLAAEVYAEEDFAKTLGEHHVDLAASAYAFLDSEGEYDRLFRVLLHSGNAEQIEPWLEKRGYELLNQGKTHVVLDCLDRITSTRIAGRPRLLLLKALALRQCQQYEESFKLTQVCLKAAQHEEPDGRLALECMIAMARILVDQGHYDKVSSVLHEALASPLVKQDQDLQCLTMGYMVISEAFTGGPEPCMKLLDQATELLKSSTASPEAQSLTKMLCSGAFALVFGNYNRSREIMADMANDLRMPMGYRIQATGNLAVSLCELGRCEHALKATDDAIRRYTDGLQPAMAATYMGTKATILAGMGKYHKAHMVMRESIKLSTAAGDLHATQLERNYLSAILRAEGRSEEALVEAEDALRYLTSHECVAVDEGWALGEVAASRLMAGDLPVAEAQAKRALELLEPLGAKQYMLRAHLVLAEKKRLEKQISAAVEELRTQADYIVSENGNWELAMYIRAFPGLLGVVATAVGVEHLPAHMLHMILPENAKTALSMAYDELAESPWRALARRLLGREEAVALELELKNRPLVRVRLFGGLEVATPEGVVSESKWKKRKARLVLAMLVVRQGQDVPRDMLLDHLWPGMREPQAKNNFYVVWSLMRRALMPDGAQPASCPYVECTGGVCRVVRPLVWSDLDEFDTVLARLDAAEKSDDVDAGLMIARRLHTIYRAELLPSELYDDWFGPTRARYRTLLGDAMLRVSRMCYKAQDPETGSQVVRYGLEHDPWREDLYQAALRYQIDAGQRSMAIETYITCRTRLAEDLGIDPSPETQRLYEEAIAMEEDEPEEK